MSREARDDPEFLMGVPERLVGLLPGTEKPGGSNSGRFTLRRRKSKPTPCGNEEGWGLKSTLAWKSASPELQSKLCQSLLCDLGQIPSLSELSPSPVN